MKARNLTKLLAISSIAFLSGCSTPDPIVEANNLDLELEQQLTQSSGGIGKEYYRLPESNDFNNIPQDPKNPLSTEKVELGKFLYHETGLAQNPKNQAGMNTYSCASCHHSKAGFQAGMPQGMGEGGSGFGVHGESRHVSELYDMKDVDVQPIRTPSAMNIAYQTNVLWNGQFGGTHLNIGTEASWKDNGHPTGTNRLGFEGIETQAIAGRDVHRLVIDKIFMTNYSTYKDLYQKAFDPASLNDPVKLKNNGALAIAAYERTLLSNQAPFQMWLRGNYGAMTDDEKEGAKLFFGKGQCSTCHNGPSLANMEFHALGMTDLTTGSYGNNEVINVTDANPEHKGRGGFTGRDEDMYKFKVPQLYNLKDSPFYGHGASFTSVKEVIQYKNAAVAQNSNVPVDKLSSQFKPLGLSEVEIDQLTEFIDHALRDPNLDRYVPEQLPTGLAFPNNDNQSIIDLGF
ncbi:cytochrome-c peroxidase [Jiulongibacter sediminis]|uniref:cytochrome-c peroxidase n=1 Tax=Jiulongibacter sediminis TaxID=1605367 RepID=UPI0026EC4291|nr:cytochrome c peroxidase [Jiulongibacter sediminis]